MKAIAQIKRQLQASGLSGKELAVRAGVKPQAVSSFLSGKRKIPMEVSIRMDYALGWEPGSISKMQHEEILGDAIRKYKADNRQKQELIKKIKLNGGFWSYRDLPLNIDDNRLIEEGLRRLDLENLPLLFNIWDKSHVKRVWKERLLPEGRRSNILNFLLAVFAFNINDPDKYITKYGKPS